MGKDKWLNCIMMREILYTSFGPRQANLVLIAYASSEGSGEPAHPRSLARTVAARSYKRWVKRNLQTESQIPGPAEWLGMRSWNLSWRNARRHKFAWRSSFCLLHHCNFICIPCQCNSLFLITSRLRSTEPWQDKTKKWVFAQRRLTSALAFAQSDQSGCPGWSWVLAVRSMDS